MCGICGFYTKQEIRKDVLQRMNDSMIHRGPDDSGEEIFEIGNGYCVGLGHRRLSILDLSPQGHQPMNSADGRVTIVFNGEIYNYPELKKELNDYPYRSSSDTEVILAAYIKWGKDFPDHLNGMFAIALYDRDTQELILARDRIGKKPLYYWRDNRKGIVFASELKPIMLFPDFSFQINKEVLSRYLFQQYINSPDTVFEQVYKLEPGSILIFHQGKIQKKKYWDIATKYQENHLQNVTDQIEAKEELKRLLKEATKRRLISDVPLGCFLSGGYDSSLITALAQEQMGAQPLKTFSIGFEDEKYDESPYAKKISEHLGTEHVNMVCTESDMKALLSDLPKYFDEPFADSSQIPTMLVSRLAKKDVTVVLSGDGGDEFFCGYNQYEDEIKAQLLDPFGAILHVIGKIGGIEEHYPFKVRVVTKNRAQETKTQFGAASYRKAAVEMVNANDRRKSVLYPTERRYNEKNWQIRKMLLDMDTYLPGDILTKVDRSSMRFSLETRCPILDKEVMEYSFRINHAFKYRRGVKKAILKEIAYEYIPKALLDRPKKGFGMPIGVWLRRDLREQLIDYSDEKFLRKQGIFEPETAHSIIHYYLKNGDQGAATGLNYSNICWAFFVFQQWYKEYFR